MSNQDFYYDLKNKKRYPDENSEIYALEEEFIKLFEAHQDDIEKLEAELNELETKKIQVAFQKFKAKRIRAYEQELLQKLSAQKQQILADYKEELLQEVSNLKKKLGVS